MMLAWLVAILVNSPSHHIRRIGPQTLQDNNLAAAAFDFYASTDRR
jgi:hypothetical protein